IRGATGYTYGTRALAWEVGLEPGPFSIIANMTDDNFSTVGSVVFRHFRVGGSYATRTEGGDFTTYGPFAGASYGRFTVLGEAAFIKEGSGATSVDKIAQYYEVNFLPVQGLNLKTAYEHFDRNTAIANRRDGQQRWNFGVELFPVQYVQLGVYYRLNQFIPQIDEENQDALIGRVHVFF